MKWFLLFALLIAFTSRATAQDDPTSLLENDVSDGSAVQTALMYKDGWGEYRYPVTDYVMAIDVALDSCKGEYHFGDTEWEWTLTIKAVKGTVSASYRYGKWNAKSQRWNSITKSIPAATIDGSVFKGTGFSGVFVRNRASGELGLVLTKGHIAEAPELGYKIRGY